MQNEFDYRFITEEISEIANRYCKGRVISVLEGGYNINTGVVSSFAQSVMTHVKFLNIGLNKNFDISADESTEVIKQNKKKQFLIDLENYRRKQRRDKYTSSSSYKYNENYDDDSENQKGNYHSDLDGEIEEDFQNNFDYIKHRPRIKKKKSSKSLSNHKVGLNSSEYSNNKNQLNMSIGSLGSLKNLNENNEDELSNKDEKEVKKVDRKEQFSNIFCEKKDKENSDLEDNNIFGNQKYSKPINILTKEPINKTIESNTREAIIDNFYSDNSGYINNTNNTNNTNKIDNNNLLVSKDIPPASQTATVRNNLNPSAITRVADADIGEDEYMIEDIDDDLLR